MAVDARVVGSLDDPIWTEPAAPPPKMGDGQRAGLLIAVVAAALIVAAPFVYLAAKHHHSGGDPGGAILQSIKQPLEALVPPGAHMTSSAFTEPQWSSACGWSVVYGKLDFSTSMTGGQLLVRANRYLVAHGWEKASFSGSTGPTTWTTAAPPGTPTGAVMRIDLTPHSASTGGEFMLTAAAPALGSSGDCQ